MKKYPSIVLLRDRQDLFAVKALSYTEMPAEEVITRAKAMIDRIHKHQEDARKKLVDEAREDARKSFFRRLFNRPIPTDEEIIAEYEKDAEYLFSPWITTYFICGNQLETAERLLRLAQNARGGLAMVAVTADDMTALADV